MRFFFDLFPRPTFPLGDWIFLKRRVVISAKLHVDCERRGEELKKQSELKNSQIDD
jgi:hypothetical protein